MAFIYEKKNGCRYKLMQGTVIVKGGIERKIYYFVAEDSTRQPKGCRVMDKLPEGYEIIETPKTFYPLVIKRRANDASESIN